MFLCLICYDKLNPTKKVCHFKCEPLIGLSCQSGLGCLSGFSCFYTLWYALIFFGTLSGTAVIRFHHFEMLSYAFICFQTLSYAFICFHTLSYAFKRFHLLSFAFRCFHICFLTLLYAFTCFHMLLHCFINFYMHWKQKCHKKNKKLAAPLFTGFSYGSR